MSKPQYFGRPAPLVQQKITTKFPSYLIIQLKRFTNNLQTRYSHKINTPVLGNNIVSLQKTQFEAVAAIKHQGPTLLTHHLLNLLLSQNLTFHRHRRLIYVQVHLHIQLW